MLTDQSVTALLEQIADETPLPAGGSVSALCGAMAAALMEMTARRTLMRKTTGQAAAKMQAVLEEAGRLRVRLSEAVDADASAYEAVLRAHRLPRGAPPETARRDQAVEEAFRGASRIPLAVAEDAATLVSLAKTAADLAAPSLAADAAAAGLIARSAALASLLNVRTNLAHIRDASFVRDLSARAEAISQRLGECDARFRQPLTLDVSGNLKKIRSPKRS